MSARINKQNILQKLNNKVEVRYFHTIDSTNNEAKRCYCDLQDSPILFVSDHQTNGRGRLGRSFYSPKNTGLYMSVLLSAPKTEDIVCITTAASVAVTKAIEKLTPLSPMIKWVNDIYVKGKKVCGILCEAVTNPISSKISAVIIGIGININTNDFPQDIKDTAGALSVNIDSSELCALITDNIIDIFQNLEQREFIAEYREHSLVIGKEITYTQNNKTETATAIDIDRNGGLIITTENGTETLSTGEISIRLRND